MGVIKQSKLLKRDSRHNNGEHRLMLRDEENETGTKAVIVVMGPDSRLNTLGVFNV